MSSKAIGVLVSGSGTNLQALIDACERGEIKGRIAVVISNKKEAYGLERAKKHGIDHYYLDPKREDYDEALRQLLRRYEVDGVVLAGYLKILGPDLIDDFRHRIINIHPSLIPSFCGKGYYGLRVHEKVYERGVKVTGATVHFVDEGTDTGPIIAQEAVSLEDEDTPEIVQQRVLAVEHRILVSALAAFCEERLVVEGNRVTIKERI